MKIQINWNQNYNLLEITKIKETLHKIISPTQPNQFWIEDLAIFLNYNFIIENPSIRLRLWNIRKPLRDLGINTDIIFRYEDLFSYKNILISHYSQQIVQQCIELRKQGKKLFYNHSENLWGYPFQSEVFNLCDYIVCCSTKLAELTQQHITSKFTKCVVIPDMVEIPIQSIIIGPIHQSKDSDRLRVVFCSMGGNSYLGKNLKPVIEKCGMELVTISEWADADIKWQRETYLEEMAKCDIAICPQNVQLQPAKSAIKVAQAMILGLPVIASPNPAYLEIIKHGENGFIADTHEQWEEALIKLKDVVLRKKISLNGFHTALQFEPHAIALKWLELLSQNRPSVALINNTLAQKYLSYGDGILDSLRLSGFEVTEYRYEDIDLLPPGYDLYLFIEVRYDPSDISNVSPKVLYTKADKQNLNNLPHFDLIVCENQSLVNNLKNRGFVNTIHQPYLDIEQIKQALQKDFIEERKQHNIKLHNDHINAFNILQLPESRWEGKRDKQHINFTMKHTKVNDKVLDIGSADGWLAVYLAKEKRQVSALEFVDRGVDFTKQQADRLNVKIDLRKGCIEDVVTVFADKTDFFKKFDCIMMFEILEHLSYSMLPWYLENVEKLLVRDGYVLISLPKQDCMLNTEHLWSPSEKLIRNTFGKKRNIQIEWVDLPNHEVSGNWFISYQI